MGRVFLLEDHDEALRVWREEGIHGLDLAHIDAHIDFGFYPARPIEKALDEARSVSELQRLLERSIAYASYERDFGRQTNIGNYIYPAMQEGMVGNFFWVVPGGDKEFAESARFIIDVIKNLARPAPRTGEIRSQIRSGIVRTRLLGRDFVVCTLERLPVLEQDVLLDIDVDFLVIDNLKNSGNLEKIGKRRPWMLPQELVAKLAAKIKSPQLTTIAYSVNGGWTPIEYKHFGDEIAWRFAPAEFRQRFDTNLKAAEFFRLFRAEGSGGHYKRAAGLNPTYRVFDNNLGPLYLSAGRRALAHREFSRIHRVDPQNPACLLGLGKIALEKKEYRRARRFFSLVLSSDDDGQSSRASEQGLIGLAEAEFNLGNLDAAKGLLARHQALEPLEPRSYYLMGHILEREGDFKGSAMLYMDAMRLGYGGMEPISRLLKLSSRLGKKNAIRKCVTARYRQFKRAFERTKRSRLREGKGAGSLRKTEARMAAFEKRLQEVE